MTRLRTALFLLGAPAAAFAHDRPGDPPAPDTLTNPVLETTVAEFEQDVNPEPTFMMTDRTYTTVVTISHGTSFRDLGFAVTAGGGISGFTDDSARDATDDGGGWDVRATIGTQMPIAVEISYLGSSQSIDALGLDNDALLVGNGVQANLRVNTRTRRAVQPFFIAGVAWRHYDLSNVASNMSDVADHDDVAELPIGAGIAYHYRGLILDARGEYRPTLGADLIPSLVQDSVTNDNEAALHRWGVNANIGYEF